MGGSVGKSLFSLLRNRPTVSPSGRPTSQSHRQRSIRRLPAAPVLVATICPLNRRQPSETDARWRLLALLAHIFLMGNAPLLLMEMVTMVTCTETRAVLSLHLSEPQFLHLFAELL